MLHVDMLQFHSAATNRSSKAWRVMTFSRKKSGCEKFLSALGEQTIRMLYTALKHHFNTLVPEKSSVMHLSSHPWPKNIRGSPKLIGFHFTKPVTKKIYGLWTSLLNFLHQINAMNL